MLRSILFLVLLLSRSALGMGRLRSIITPAIVSCLAASDYKLKRLLTDSKMDHEINKLIEEQELLSPPFRGGICDNTSLETPSDYIKIIPGKTPGFDHVKFARLKAKYLDAVNQEIWAAVEKSGMSKADLEAADIALVEKAKGYGLTFYYDSGNNYERIDSIEDVTTFNYRVCSTKIDAKTCQFIVDKLRKHGLKPEKIIIDKVPESGVGQASVKQPFDLLPHDIAILKIYSSDVCFKIIGDDHTYPCTRGGILLLVSKKQYWDFIIEHEICHLLHRDSLVSSLISSDQQQAISKIYEKRADIFAVFNCSNPVAGALGNKRIKKLNDFYDHGASSDWHIMTDEIISCYSDGIKAKWCPSLYMRAVGYAFGDSASLFPKIEHVEE